MTEIPTLIGGGLSIDDRGSLAFVNDFSFLNIKRFYVVSNFSTKVVRAFHFHADEEKFIFVMSGSAIVCAGRIPSEGIKPHRFVMSRNKPAILRIPRGYANGFRALEPDTSLMFYSSATLEESQTDDERYPWDYWGKEIWEVANR